MKTLFIDTNLFLQCKSFDDIDWSLISTEDNLLLLISRPVQEEIDNLKQSGNGRRAKRARKANSFIRKILLSQNSLMLIKERPTRVTVGFSPPVILQKEFPCILDFTYPDDRIIAEALMYRDNNQDSDVAILTHDTNPLLTAMNCNLPYIAIPDQWLLPSENDERDKKIFEQERIINELKSHLPELVFSASSIDDEEIDKLTLELDRYEELSEDEISDLILEAKSHTPKKTIEDGVTIKLPVMTEEINPSKEELEHYKNKQYPKWLADAENFLRTLPSKLEAKKRCFGINISLSNIGAVPAENVVLELKSHASFFMASRKNEDDRDKKPQKINFPKRPPQPTSRVVFKGMREPIAKFAKIITQTTMPVRSDDYLSLANNINAELFKQKKHDRNAFYWKSGESLSTIGGVLSLECDEFKHKMGNKVFRLKIHFPIGEPPSKSFIKCIVSAKNLRSPIEFIIPISIKFTDRDTFAIARQFIRDS